MGARRLWLLGALALAVLGVVLAQAVRDVTPPNVWLELEDLHETSATFFVAVSADEPATFTLTYGSQRVEVVDQAFRASLEALDGAVPLVVVATDGAGNESVSERTVRGVRLAVPELVRSGGEAPGQAFTIVVRVSPNDAPLVTPSLTIDDRNAPLFASDTDLYAFGATPLTLEAGFTPLTLTWADALGRDAARTSAVPFGPLPATVEELDIPASTLAVITPEGRELEAATIAAVTADPTEPPRWTEPWELPIEGRATSGFAVPRRYAPGGPVSFHEGEDIAAPLGTPVASPNDGRVVVAGMFPIKGGMIILDHGAGITTRYYHLSRIGVEVGDEVRRGTFLGEVGSTGLSTGPHLHWELRVAGRPTDPLAWVGRVRP